MAVSAEYGKWKKAFVFWLVQCCGLQLGEYMQRVLGYYPIRGGNCVRVIFYVKVYDISYIVLTVEGFCIQ